MIVLTYRIPVSIYDKKENESIREWNLKYPVIKEINDSLRNDLDYFDDLMYYNVDDKITLLVSHTIPLDVSMVGDVRPYVEVNAYSSCESLSSEDIERIREALANKIIPDWSDGGFDCGKDNRYHITLDNLGVYYSQHLFITDEIGQKHFKDWKADRKKIIISKEAEEAKKSLSDLWDKALKSCNELGQMIKELKEFVEKTE